MSEAGLHPLEMILRLCAAVAPEPWYPRLFAKQEGVDRQALGRCLEELWMSGLIERADGGPEKGPAISLTRDGQRVLLDPEALEHLRAGEPVSSNDRGGIIRGALRSRMRPVVTVALVLLNVMVFAWGYLEARAKKLDNDFLSGTVAVKGPLTLEDVRKQNEVYRIQEKSGSVSAYNLIEGEWWRLLTAGFVHIGFLHLLMNMVFLYLAGRFIEQMWGHVRYLIIYLSAVLGGSCLATAHNVAGVAGASGAVCGLLGAEGVWFLFNRRYLPRDLLRRARMIFLVNLVLLIFISSFKNVSAWGHFGGAAAGALTAMLLQLHRFGPPVWRWLAIVGFAPMAWYGQYAIEHARATDPEWLAVEDKQFVHRHYGAVQKAMKKARQVYSDEVKPVLEIHPTRRKPAKVEKVLSSLEEQNRELTSVADGLARAGPYHSPDAKEARKVGQQYVFAAVELFNRAENLLRRGEKRTDKDRRALREQEDQVEERRREWRKLFQ
ncbi:MAG: rhomboid family intramembrane serine protease [Gemmataceae bacterium]